jgi:2-polyprenyl-6-methoxyphenol hydroxylase-like FAD-dependent oxidoreductase
LTQTYVDYIFLLTASFEGDGEMTKDQDFVDVVVAGGGPVGLMLACELRLAGVGVVVLERRTEIDMTIKAGALNLPTVQALYHRGMLPALKEARAANAEKFAAFMKQQTGASRPGPRFVGHFGGIVLDAGNLDPADPDLTAGALLGPIGMVGQQQLEAILEARAVQLGADVRRGVSITGFETGGFEAGDELIISTDQGPLRAGWLLGCDGGRSLVRKLAGFDFPGTAPEITAYQALAQIEGGEGLRPGWNITDTGVYAFGPIPGRVLVAEFGGAPADRDAPITEAELEGAVRRVTGADVRVTAIETATRFTDNARQATTYRIGRVLLAGDAAHVHSPFGGQGLNLGMGDAMNLGWKLAATIQGWAPDGLLDTYTTERHPIGAWVLDWTRAQIAIMRPDPHARALRKVVGDLAATVDGTTYLAKRISGAWQGYDLPGDHPWVGRVAPDLELGDGTRPADHLADGRALLLDLADDADLRHAAAGYSGRLTVHTTTAITSVDGGDARALLVRPDGIVAWVATDETSGLDKHLALWLGEPAS